MDVKTQWTHCEADFGQNSMYLPCSPTLVGGGWQRPFRCGYWYHLRSCVRFLNVHVFSFPQRRINWVNCHCLVQKSANFICKGQDCTYFWLCSLYGLSCNYSPLPSAQRRHGLQVNDGAWVCSRVIDKSRQWTRFGQQALVCQPLD